MTWNYRVVKDSHTVNGLITEVSFSIREVYYDDDNDDWIVSWTAEPSAPVGDTWLECVDNHLMMSAALGLPVVDVTSGSPVQISRF